MNKKILLFVGHGKSNSGGYDPGACSRGFEEFQLAKEIAVFAAKELSRSGYDVDLENYDKSLNLPERIAYENRNPCDLVLEFHLNAGGGTGTECYYSNENNAGKAFAEGICSEISKALSIKNRGAKTKLDSKGNDYFGIIRDTKATALLIETCFIDTDDVFKVDNAKKREVVGKAVALAVAKKV